ncbi:MAG: hypothetical protein MRJ65_03180 [Candidatus Brocadiaceae bacterium]|nr:hypothetical protein [Candidatus Brocadiaceae bacterium]
MGLRKSTIIKLEPFFGYIKELQNQGKTTSDISKILEDEHEIKVAQSTIRSFLKIKTEKNHKIPLEPMIKNTRKKDEADLESNMLSDDHVALSSMIRSVQKELTDKQNITESRIVQMEQNTEKCISIIDQSFKGIHNQLENLATQVNKQQFALVYSHILDELVDPLKTELKHLSNTVWQMKSTMQSTNSDEEENNHFSKDIQTLHSTIKRFTENIEQVLERMNNSFGMEIAQLSKKIEQIATEWKLTNPIGKNMTVQDKQPLKMWLRAFMICFGACGIIFSLLWVLLNNM